MPETPVGSVVTANGSGNIHRRHLPDLLGIMTPIPSKPIEVKTARNDAGKLVFPMILALQAVDPEGFGAGGHYIGGKKPLAYEVPNEASFRDIERVNPVYVRVFGDFLPGAVPAEYLVRPEDVVERPEERAEILSAKVSSVAEALRESNAALAAEKSRNDALEKRLAALESALGGGESKKGR